MPRHDDDLLDPEIVETLAAIDATLAGESIDPSFAEIAELSLLLAADRPQTSTQFAGELDDRVRARFVRPARAGAPRRWLRSPRWAFGAAGVGALAAAAVVVALVSGGGQKPGTLAQPAAPQSLALKSTPRSAAPGAATGNTDRQPCLGCAPNSSSASPPAPGTATPLRPPSNGRQIVQSAMLDLGAQPARIDEVAQEVLNVVGSVNGIVDRSSVTATGRSDGNAQFELRVPSASLQRTMSALSRLQYANVVSRTDNTQDVNTRFVDANRQLADAAALRATLIKQLAKATSQQQIDSIKAQIAAAEARIANAQAALRALDRQVSYSHVSVTIAASAAPPVAGSGFTLHRAAHDALRVLTVAAGIALIALAVMVPAGLLGALGLWAFAAIRRRRREQALDLA